MAVGGSYNKGNGSSGSSGNSNRGRSYGLMLLLAFGAALLGVMILHKLRERRIFTLLVKDKDRELFSLHLILQKERDYIKEVKRKNEEMKTKIYSLRTQKMELHRRIIEMQSTIDSLKDEQRTMETAIEEKQSEIKLLRSQIEMGTEKENSQMADLVESLKQKEAEVEELKKHHLEHPEKVWPLSTDDPSNPPVNITVAEDQKDQTGEDREVNQTAIGEGETARVENGDGNKVGLRDDRREIMGKQIEKPGTLQDQRIKNGVSSSGGEKPREKEGQGKKTSTEDSRDGSSLKVGEENKASNSTGAVSHNGGMKLEIREDSENAVWSGARGKRSTVSNGKGKKWILVAKNRRLENNNGRNGRVTSTRSKRFYEDDQIGLRGKVKSGASNGGVVLMGGNRQLEGRKGIDSSKAKVLESQNSEKTDNKVVNLDSMKKRLEISLDGETQLNRSTSERRSEITVEDGDQKAEVRKSQDQEAIDISNEATDDHEEPEDLKTTDEEQSGKLAGVNDFSGESGLSSEENSEEYKEEIDESE